MSDIKNWSNLASGNNSAPPDGAPEGTTKFSDVNDIVREMMAAIRRQHETAQWIDLGHTVSFATASSFKVTGSDVRTTYTDGRRVVTYNGGGTVYGGVLSTTFAAGDTTITLAVDSGSLDSSLSSAAVGILTPTSGAAISTAGSRQSVSALASETLSTSALAAQTATISALTANNITVSALNAQLSTISALTADHASISALDAEAASISALVAGSITASVINAGSLAVNGYTVGRLGAWAKVVQSLTACSIAAGFNVSTVSARGTGRYTVKFTNAAPSANYGFAPGVIQKLASIVAFIGEDATVTSGSNASQFGVIVINSGGAAINPDNWYCSFYW